MSGTWGALATGLFATTAVNSAGFDGLFYGNPGQFFTQLIATVITIVFAFGMTFAIATILKRTMGLRVDTNEEEVGLDISEHGERAYV
jgi:Amt family ammonium transporter